MKYTVEGFSQKSLIDYGLDEKDALILRYFIDFKDSGKMKMKVINKVPYYWLKGSALLEQLPILRINNIDVLRRRLKKMTSCKILMHEHVLEGGSYAFYAVGENYENLLSYDDLNNGSEEETSENHNDEHNEKSEGITEKKESLSEKSDHSDLKVGTKDYSINKSINNNTYSTPYEAIVNMFNDICRSFPKVKVRNKTRDNLMRKMYKNIGIDEIRAVFEMAERSDYLSGRNEKWLNCSFDWIIKENNYIKVLEGNYTRYSESNVSVNNIKNHYSNGEKEHDSYETEDNDHDTDECEIIINTELLEDL